ncbi:uncharacterized protein LOC130046318 [Ostrea edulis]|uniref:uncharacterized protein LOC130046318 n=1 Tax=Ostrea edulis TaxID=37623 RepID=UPI0024AF5495|nr:uncharacterized protein LOC130046318 [Ostrea edulis]
MARPCLSLLVSLISSVFIGVADARYCYSRYSNGSYYSTCTYSSYYYVPVGSIVGAVIGCLAGLATLIGLLVFFCCIRPRRLAARGRVLQATAGPAATVISTSTAASTAQMGGGYVNTASYPPGTQATYPQHSYPPQQQAPSTGYQPPPSFK